MAAETTIELIAYYANLLIRQYVTLPKAYATIETVVTPLIMPQTTVETISFALIPTSGEFTLDYNGSALTISWDETTEAIERASQMLPPGTIYGGSASTASWLSYLYNGNAVAAGFSLILNGGDAAGWGLSETMVSGSIAEGELIVSFTDVTPPAGLLMLVSSSLESGSVPVTPVIAEVDLTLPLAVENAFNLLPPIASGVQLDVIAKYVGVTRTALGYNTQITLDDADFLTLIQMGIIRNSFGSSLAQIQQFIHQFFPGDMLVFDYQNMEMGYMISAAIGSLELLQVVIVEGLLPKPMGVQISSIIYAPTINNFFGFRRYSLPPYNVSGFNLYSDFQATPWLSYVNSIII